MQMPVMRPPFPALSDVFRKFLRRGTKQNFKNGKNEVLHRPSQGRNGIGHAIRGPTFSTPPPV